MKNAEQVFRRSWRTAENIYSQRKISSACVLLLVVPGTATGYCNSPTGICRPHKLKQTSVTRTQRMHCRGLSSLFGISCLSKGTALTANDRFASIWPTYEDSLAYTFNLRCHSACASTMPDNGGIRVIARAVREHGYSSTR